MLKSENDIKSKTIYTFIGLVTRFAQAKNGFSERLRSEN